MPKIIHKKKNCIGCGACASVCLEMFEMSEKDGLAFLKNSKEINGVFELETDNIVDCAREAANVCPINIIEIQD